MVSFSDVNIGETFIYPKPQGIVIHNVCSQYDHGAKNGPAQSVNFLLILSTQLMDIFPFKAL